MHGDYIRPYKTFPLVVAEGATVKLPFETSKDVNTEQLGNQFEEPGGVTLQIDVRVMNILDLNGFYHIFIARFITQQPWIFLKMIMVFPEVQIGNTDFTKVCGKYNKLKG